MTGGATISQPNTPSRSSQRPSEKAERRLTAAGARTAVMRLRRFVDLLELTLGVGDHLLGGFAGASLGEHVDDDELRDGLRLRPAERRRPARQMRGLERVAVRQVAWLDLPHRRVVVGVQE